LKHLHHIDFPDPEISNYIKHFWSVNEVHKNLKEKVIPIGVPELIYLERPYRCLNQAGNTMQEGKGWILMGQRTKVMDICSIDSIKVFGIRFWPWGMYNLIKIPVHEFNDTVISLSDISPKLVKELEDSIAGTGSHAERCKKVQKLLLKKLDKDKPRAMPVILDTLLTIKSADKFSVLEHSERAGISHKNLNRAFKNYTGLTVKEYHKIYRLKKVLNILSAGIIPNWAELASSAGFFDQAHLIKEFKVFTGYTPIEYLFRYKTGYFDYL
jgi:AraC-like DNA-binding protein